MAGKKQDAMLSSGAYRIEGQLFNLDRALLFLISMGFSTKDAKSYLDSLPKEN